MALFRILFFLAFSAYLLFLPSSIRRWTHPFTPQKIAIETPYRPEWELELSEAKHDEITTILSQPFRYIGKGLQTFAFESQDGKYVLKLFRFDGCRIPYGQRLLRWGKDLLGLSSRIVMPLDERMSKTFGSCLLSYHKLKEETGIVWVHLNPTPSLWPLIQVQDRLGRWHTLDPAKFRFAVQKKGTLLRAALESAYSEDPEKFARMVDSFRELLNTLEGKGIYNLDPKMASNFGFIGEKAIQIDFGNFVEDTKRASYHADHFASRFKGYLEKKFPEK